MVVVKLLIQEPLLKTSCIYLRSKNKTVIKNTLFLSAFLVLSVAGFCQNSGKLLLSEGQKYIIENKITVASEQEMMGQPMNSIIDLFTSNNIEVKEIKNDNYNLTNTYTKITAHVNAMGQDMNFDSDKKDMDGEMGSGMKNLIGQPKTVVIDKNGKIVTGKTDTAGNGSGAGIMSMMMKQVMGSPEESGYGLGEAFLIIPQASKGFNWTDSSSMEGAKRSTTYTIKEINGTDAIVTLSGILNVDSKGEMQGVEVATKSSGKITGEQVVDLKTGLIKQKNIAMEGSGKVTAMGQEIPTTTKMTTVTTIKSL